MKELASILKNIKNKELLPIYFFHGEEPFFIDAAVKALENDVLTEDEKAFNQTILYGKDTTYRDVLALARQFPMLGDRQVIVLKEAQDIKLTEAESAALKSYVENPVPSTVLVVAHKHKKLDARSSFARVLKKNNQLFYSEKLKDYAATQWIDSEIRRLGFQAAPDIPALLSQYLGTDLSRISNELHKLKMILGPNSVLDAQVIEKHIGISKDFNVFELINALGEKDKAAAFRIAHYIGKNPSQNPFVMMMGNIYNYFSNLILLHTMPGASQQDLATAMRIHPYFVKNMGNAARNYNLKSCTRIISILRETDLKNKGLGATRIGEGDLLREMVYKILHVEQFRVQT